MNYWYENTGARDAEIRNCSFIDCGCGVQIVPSFTPTEAEPYYHKNIRIVNNHFINCAQMALKANHTDGIIFKGNTDNNGHLLGAESVNVSNSNITIN